jgi:hypothetical protein
MTNAIPVDPPAPETGAIVITTGNAADTFRDVAERAIATAVITALTFLVTADGLNFTLSEGAFTAGLVAGWTVVFTFIRAATPQSFSNAYVDIMVRMGWTFLQVSLGLVMAATFNWGDFNSWMAAGSAGLAAALSLAKGWIAERFISNTITPASMFKAAAAT